VDKAAIDRHIFEVNYAVPQNDSQAILELAGARAAYADIPEHLLQYEVLGLTVEDLEK
jgi:hypothetical protein